MNLLETPLAATKDDAPVRGPCLAVMASEAITRRARDCEVTFA